MQRWVVLAQKCLTQINIMYGGNVSYGEGNVESVYLHFFFLFWAIGCLKQEENCLKQD